MCLPSFACVTFTRLYGEGWFGEDAFLVEYAVRVAEPIGFLAAALWVLPRFHRTFIVLFAVPYCTFEMLFIVMKITCSDSPWRDASLATTSLVSCVAPRYVVSVLTPVTGKGSRDENRRHCSEGDRCRNAFWALEAHQRSTRHTRLDTDTRPTPRGTGTTTMFCCGGLSVASGVSVRFGRRDSARRAGPGRWASSPSSSTPSSPSI